MNKYWKVTEQYFQIEPKLKTYSILYPKRHLSKGNRKFKAATSAYKLVIPMAADPAPLMFQS
jgi:hypothetical protein